MRETTQFTNGVMFGTAMIGIALIDGMRAHRDHVRQQRYISEQRSLDAYAVSCANTIRHYAGANNALRAEVEALERLAYGN
jgi:adenylate kinase